MTAQIRSWVNALNRSWQGKRPTLKDDIYMDYGCSTPSGNYEAQERNIRGLKMILAPRGWTMEEVRDHTGYSIGVWVPELDEEEVPILLEKFWEMYPDAADDQLLILFSYYAWKCFSASLKGYHFWSQMTEQDWAWVQSSTERAYGEEI